MGRDLRQEALTYLLEKADKQGYVTFDDIMDCADAQTHTCSSKKRRYRHGE